MERTVTVVPEAGLHARPAATVVQTVNQHEASVQLATDGSEPVPANSMLAVSGLGVATGEQVRVIADGPDAESVLDAIEAILSSPLEEE